MRPFLLVVVMLIALPFAASASTVVRTGEVVSLAADQVVEGDFYGLGSTAAVSGEVTEDLLLFGGTVTVNGEVGADMAIVGGSVDIHGTVQDDVRVIGGTVVVAGTIEGNLVVVASELKVLSTAVIGGDLMFFGGSADLSGSVGNDVLGTSERLRIDGAVEGDVDVKVGSVVVGDRAEISGRLSYDSAQELVRSQNAVIKGDIVRSEATVAPENGFRSLVVAFLVTLFASLVMFLLVKPFALRVVEQAEEHEWRSLLIGFGVVFLAPIASVILLVSTLGSLVGMLLIMTYFALLCLAFSLCGMVAGSYLMRFAKQSKTVSVITIALGTAVLFGLMFVPVLGPLVVMLIFMLTLGVVSQLVVRLLRS